MARWVFIGICLVLIIVCLLLDYKFKMGANRRKEEAYLRWEIEHLGKYRKYDENERRQIHPIQENSGEAPRKEATEE